MLRRPFGAEIVDLGAEAEDEVVVAHRREILEAHLSSIEVDAGHACLMKDRVVLPAEQVAQGVAHGRRFDQTGRKLVEQRLEGVVVVAVDQHDLGVSVLERVRGADAGEAAAENEHPRAPGLAVGRGHKNASKGTTQPRGRLIPAG